MNDPLVLQIVGGLVAAFFIFLMVMCWKTWRFMHIFFSFLVFAGAVAFLWIASMTLKTHHAWRKPYEDLTEEIKKAEAEKKQHLHGDLNEVEQADDSARSLRAELDRSLVERGRVWRECTPSAPTNEDPASFTLQVRTVPASLPQGATPVPNGIVIRDAAGDEVKPVLYAFAEAENEDGWRVPAFYLGEFSVTNATPTDVVLKSMLPLLPDQVQRIRQGGTTWALYEIMPLDGHEILAEMDETEKRMVGLDRTELTKYITNPGLPQDKYDAIIEQFHRFNREANEEDPPENTWMMVKFVRDHSIQVDSDAEQSLLEPDGRYFDTSGRAVEGRVRRGEEGTVEFEVGETGIFDLDTADTLIADGVAEKVKLIYRRDLHDYTRIFAEARQRHKDLDASIARAQREYDTYVALKAMVDADIIGYNDEKVKLEQDLEGFRRELKDATAYALWLDGQWQKALQDLSALYRANNQMVEELTRLQSQLTQEIKRRTAEATARASTPTSAQ